MHKNRAVFTTQRLLYGESSSDFWVAEAFASQLQNNETQSPPTKLRVISKSTRGTNGDRTGPVTTW